MQLTREFLYSVPTQQEELPGTTLDPFPPRAQLSEVAGVAAAGEPPAAKPVRQLCVEVVEMGVESSVSS